MKNVTIKIEFSTKELDQLFLSSSANWMHECPDRFSKIHIDAGFRQYETSGTMYYFDDYVALKIFQAYAKERFYRTAIFSDETTNEYVLITALKRFAK